eukprot:1145191-Pelagomonas_calceolata.AAC.4
MASRFRILEEKTEVHRGEPPEVEKHPAEASSAHLSPTHTQFLSRSELQSNGHAHLPAQICTHNQGNEFVSISGAYMRCNCARQLVGLQRSR